MCGIGLDIDRLIPRVEVILLVKCERVLLRGEGQRATSLVLAQDHHGLCCTGDLKDPIPTIVTRVFDAEVLRIQPSLANFVIVFSPL